MKYPVLFLSHGGGPWPWIPEMKEELRRTFDELRKLGRSLRPRAVLMISGHWEESEFTVATTERPGMIYDYGGFPPHTYQISYPAPGAPDVALKAKSLLEQGGIKVKEDSTRGFDHGTFVPLYCLYPEADIPVAQLSLKNDLSPEEHYKVGELLAPLREEEVLIIGSGLSYHNLRNMFQGKGGEDSRLFEKWLTQILKDDPKKILGWKAAPGARASHPREDHLAPLFVIAGAAQGDKGSRILLDHSFGVDMASYSFP